MALSRVQAVSNAATAAPTVTLDTTAVSGNLLVAFQGSRVGDAVDIPAGFTRVLDSGINGASVTAVLSFKVSDGTETEVVFPDNGVNRCIVVEIGGDSPELDVFAEDETNIATAVQSQSTGTTGETAVADEIAMAFISASDQRNWEVGTNSFNNGFSLVLENNGAPTSAAATIYGEKTLTATGTVETTCTTTDTGDEAYGCIMTVREAAAAGGGGFRSRIAGGLVLTPV